MKRRLLIAATALWSVTVTANPCREDIQKFCSGIEPGQGRIAQCLKQNESRLSAACREKGPDMKARFKAAQEACVADVKKHCSGVEPGGGRIIQCLQENEDKLSAECKEVQAKVKQRGEKLAELRDACAEDVKALCANAVSQGPGKVRRCLRDNRDKVSQACRETFKTWRGRNRG